MSDDFIEGDEFDPEVVARAEDAQHEYVVEKDEQVSAYLRRRKQAYVAVFSTDACSQDDLEFVMMDLAQFCRAYTPTFHATNQKIQDALEGRREVYMRIMDYTRLSHDMLYVKVTDAQTKAG